MRQAGLRGQWKSVTYKWTTFVPLIFLFCLLLELAHLPNYSNSFFPFYPLSFLTWYQRTYHWMRVSTKDSPATPEFQSPILTASQILGIYWTAKLILPFGYRYNHLKFMGVKRKHSRFTFELIPPYVPPQ